MRELKIKRMKSFVACGVRDKVYIEDYDNPDIKINKIPCRKLGKLKNGEEKIFEIDDNAARLYVICDKLSKNYCNDYYPLPEGNENIVLCGTNQYNPFVGNPFRFYGVDENEEVRAHRKKNTKKGIVTKVLVFLIAFVLCIALGFATAFLLEAEPQSFESNGMSITLTDEFYESEVDGYTFCYESYDTVVLGLREGFDLAEGFENCTLDEYADLIIENNGIDQSVEVQHRDGVTYFEYVWTNPDSDVNYVYYTAVYKSTDAFWQIQFIADEENYDGLLPEFEKYAKSIQFAG